jgi:hypothetical protein
MGTGSDRPEASSAEVHVLFMSRRLAKPHTLLSHECVRSSK